MNEEPKDVRQALQRLDAEVPARTGDALLAVIARAATDPAVDVTKMERLLAMQERVQARDAEMAFNAAMKCAQSAMPVVPKDAKNASTNSLYARLETLNKLITPVYTAHGFSLSYGSADCPLPDHRRIVCKVAHCAGHSRDYFLDLPLDMVGMKGSANKTAIHGYGSTISYGRRYLALMIFNVATGEDDDGNSAGGSGEGPEVKIGLKLMLWNLLKEKSKVQAGQGWKEGRQVLVDEMCLDPDRPIDNLSSVEWRAVLAAARKKL